MAIAFWLARDLFGDLPVEVELPVQWHADALPRRADCGSNSMRVESC